MWVYQIPGHELQLVQKENFQKSFSVHIFINEDVFICPLSKERKIFYGYKIKWFFFSGTITTARGSEPIRGALQHRVRWGEGGAVPEAGGLQWGQQCRESPTVWIYVLIWWMIKYWSSQYHYFCYFIYLSWTRGKIRPPFLSVTYETTSRFNSWYRMR